MVVNTGSWHYKFYRWTYKFYGGGKFNIDNYSWDIVPERSNLCQYIQRIVGFGSLSAFIGVTAMPMVYIFYYVIKVPLMFLIGYRPLYLVASPFTLAVDGMKFVEYKYYSIKGWELYPANVLIPAITIAGICFGDYKLYTHSHYEFLIINGTILFFIISFIFAFYFPESESGKLVKSYFSAKKQGICPLIEFKDEATRDE